MMFDILSDEEGVNTLPTFDYDGMRKKSNADFAEQYCRIETQPCQTSEQFELQDKIMGIYLRELKRRVVARLIHPKEFEKLCEQAYIKIEQEKIEKAKKDGIDRPYF